MGASISRLNCSLLAVSLSGLQIFFSSVLLNQTSIYSIIVNARPKSRLRLIEEANVGLGNRD